MCALYVCVLCVCALCVCFVGVLCALCVCVCVLFQENKLTGDMKKVGSYVVIVKLQVAESYSHV